ncbi:MAG: hypothetical protein U5K84_11865 [Alkalibacterium sp.]|nr:hypothetical protein [Alkalibacterium sp.]
MMNKFKKSLFCSAALLSVSVLGSTVAQADEAAEAVEMTYLKMNTEPLLSVPDEFPTQFKYDSGVEIAYPEDGVKGVFVTANSAGGSTYGNPDTVTERY